jgi:hypothetical protein
VRTCYERGNARWRATTPVVRPLPSG